MFSQKDFEDVMWGREFYESVSSATKEAVDHTLRNEALRICNIDDVYSRRSAIYECPEILRGYLKVEIERIWKIKIDRKR
ncbi:hypothetical protein V19_46 [Brucella phage V_19]|nr:hypothetical protein F354_gp46 [Brucella phage Tb]YP_007002111.1 hypothetical protein F355_gp45 [Brucella phage Pr]AHB81105.1 hypothetical protein Bk_45 [Brucella phage Bk]AHB81162.1 hypothetical protein Fz_46 [Brucella phage Fz]AHB81219.1 hypothetical protein R/C_45 [Brucella phage R/C]AHB81275.1 hypothetical protein S708_45 [Brucella phage S708]AHB81389.1 hypothetical protein Wb_45 [Brucella phage Wb]AKO59034.1 hypothetical protein p0219_46 [Brucella phage 02_19]AKO59092.1 hypothetical